MAKHKADGGGEELLRRVEQAERRGLPAEQDDCVVLFADIVGYSSYANRRGDAAALELVRCFEGAARGPIGETGGQVIMTAGDAILARWPTELLPDAVRVAERMVDELERVNEGRRRTDQIHVRVGIHCGQVMRLQDGDLIGNGVNLACRVQTAALPDEILLSVDAAKAYQGCGDVSPTHRLGMMGLKGIDAPVEVYRVERPGDSHRERALRDAVARALLPTRWPFGAWVFFAIGTLLAAGTFSARDFSHPSVTAGAFWVCFLGCAMLWAAYLPRTVSRWHVPLRLLTVAVWIAVFGALGGLAGVWG